MTFAQCYKGTWVCGGVCMLKSFHEKDKSNCTTMRCNKQNHHQRHNNLRNKPGNDARSHFKKVASTSQCIRAAKPLNPSIATGFIILKTFRLMNPARVGVDSGSEIDDMRADNHKSTNQNSPVVKHNS